MRLMARFSSMLDKFQSRDSNISCSDSSAVLGQSATNTEPVSRRPTDRIKYHTGLRFRKGREDPVPQEDIITCDSVIDETPVTPRYPLGDTGEPQGSCRAPAFVSLWQAGAGFDSHHDDDDRESNTDGSFSDESDIRLLHYSHDRFPYRKQPPLLKRHLSVYSRSSFHFRRLHRR